MRVFIKYLKRILKRWFLQEKPGLAMEYSDEELLKKAGEELSEAHNLLSRVQDGEMIEYAVLRIQAAEKRYDYLLKKIKERENYIAENMTKSMVKHGFLRGDCEWKP